MSNGLSICELVHSNQKPFFFMIAQINFNNIFLALIRSNSALQDYIQNTNKLELISTHPEVQNILQYSNLQQLAMSASHLILLIASNALFNAIYYQLQILDLVHFQNQSIYSQIKTLSTPLKFLKIIFKELYHFNCYQRKANQFEKQVIIQMQNNQSVQNVTVKISFMLVLIILDIIINSFIECSFGLSFQSLFYVNFYFLPIQMVITALLLIMVMILLWQTFPLRYGLITTLLSQFKFTFIVLLIFIAITALERGLRLSYVMSDQGNYSDALIWNNIFYQVVYYVRFLAYPIFYAFLINFCMQVVDPSYYKPERWLK